MIPSAPKPSPRATEPPRRVEMRIESDPAQIAAIRRCAEDFAAGHGFDCTATGAIGLCLNEALANVMRHAYDNRSGRPIVITMEYVAKAVPAPLIQMMIRDWGKGVNPDSLPPKPYDPLTPGGVGLICLGKLMDSITYEPQPDGMLMTMVKKKVGS
jgi:serine/threonine-protein kinase RsbW